MFRRVLAISAVAILASCATPPAQKEPPPTEPPLAAPEPEDLALAAVLRPWTGDLDGMIERRMVRFLVVLSRTHYFVDRGTQRGLSYEMGKQFETELNAALPKGTPRVGVVFVPVTRDRLLDALIQGQGDVAAANLTITPQRQERIDFATPVTSDVYEVVVTAKAHAPIASVDALSGMKVFVRETSSYFESLTALNARLRAAKQAPVDIQTIDERLEDEDILEMVNSGIVPATVVDNHIARFWSSVLDDLQVHDAARVREGGAIAWALRKNSPKLEAKLDAFSTAHRKGTYLTNVLTQKYLRDNKWVKNPTAEADMARFRNAVDLFRTYGDKYDLPWLLVAAQGYQESGIDQSKRSPSGAVGVMQIKPSTAEGPPILITGVESDMDRNIEAGAKYLRFIVDQYYANAPMDDLNKGIFAVASYNAGPARIQALRREATAMGLDANQWFGNVELVAARRIGRETVTYVSNIFKYYVAYTLSLNEIGARKQAAEAIR
jgi:membrane-bound lytic murein transglycosylase MltF